MNKREIYNALEVDGAKLQPYERMTVAQLNEIFRERFGYVPGDTPRGKDSDASREQTPQEHDPAAVDASHDNDTGEHQESSQGAANVPQMPEDDASESGGGKLEDTPKRGAVPALFFSSSGWCDTLNRSYFVGHFQPCTWAEYDALKPFATEPSE